MNPTRVNQSNQHANGDIFLPQTPDIERKHQLSTQYKQTIPLNIYHFYLNDEIDRNDYYLDLINTLKTSTQNDTIYLYLNNRGGRLDTTYQIINNMLASPATVITCIEGQACSAASMIFMHGHKKIIGKYATFMAHFYSGGLFGKGHEMASRLEHYQEEYETFMRETYDGLLSEEELTLMTNGKDFYLSSRQVAERLGLRCQDDMFYTDIEQDGASIINEELVKALEDQQKAQAEEEEQNTASENKRKTPRRKTATKKKE